jgi:type I restriction enzyme S subunit
MSLKKINQLFNFEKGVLQSSKCIEGEYDFITAAADWKTHNEYSHDFEALIFAAAASGSLGRTHYVNGKFISSDLCFILTPKEPEKLPVDLKFYHIIFNLYKNEIVAATKAGTSKEAIGLKVFGEYELPYFDITLQNKVKAEFGKAEELKNSLFDEYSTQLTQLENLNQAILQEAVQGKLVKQDPKDEPASELLKRIKAEKAKSGKKEKPLPPIKPEEIPFEIPESWVWCRLGEITNYGSSPKAEPTDLKTDTWVLDLEDIEKITSNLLCKIRFNERNSLSTKSVFKTGDVLYSKLRPYLDKVIVADEDGVCTTEILPLKCFADLNPFYLKYALKRADFIKYVNSKTKGMKMPRLGTKEGEMALIPLPTLSEQKRIVAEIEKQFAKTKQLKEHIIANQQATEQLLKALLHQAFEVREEEEV